VAARRGEGGTSEAYREDEDECCQPEAAVAGHKASPFVRGDGSESGCRSPSIDPIPELGASLCVRGSSNGSARQAPLEAAGLAIQDLAIALAAMKRADELGLATIDV